MTKKRKLTLTDSLIIIIPIVLVFEYLRIIVSNLSLTMSLVMTIIMTIVTIGVIRNGFGKPKNLGIIALLLFATEYLRILDSRTFLAGIIASIIYLVIAVKLNGVK